MDGRMEENERERDEMREMREMDERWMRDRWEIDEKCVLCMDFTNIVNSLEILGMFSTRMGVWPYWRIDSISPPQVGVWQLNLGKKAAEW